MKNNLSKILVTTFSAAILSGCMTMAPDYERPTMPVAPLLAENQASQESPLELKAWQDFFTDPNAHRLIQTALDNNRDLRIAASNVAIAQARYQINRDAHFPSIGATSDQAVTKNSLNYQGNESISRLSRASVGIASYEIDFFGKIESLKDAALADYFSTLEAERATKLSLISATANAYYDWLFANKSFQLAKRTLESREQSLDLIQKRLNAGIASDLDLAQAQAAKSSVAAQKAQLQQLLHARKASLELLLGAPLSSVDLIEPQVDSLHLGFDLPENINSQVLLNRPDVLSAEQSLIAANANIGAARAAFFPSISLGGSVGFSSLEFDDLFDGNSETWSFFPSINIPIFNNNLKSNLAIAEAQQQALLAQYEKSIQLAFAETYQQMANGESLQEEISANESLVKAQSQRLDLAEAKYKAGLASYIEVLNSQQELFGAQQALLESERSRLTNTIGLYKSLGGGDQWQSPSQQLAEDSN